MWTTYLSLFTLVQVIYASIIAFSLKGVADVENVVYYNTANIAISSGLLGAELAILIGQKYCGKVQLDMLASVLLILSAIVSMSLFSVMVSHAQFANVPAGAKQLIYFGIAGNVVILLLSIYSIYYSMEHRHEFGEIISGRKRLFRVESE